MSKLKHNEIEFGLSPCFYNSSRSIGIKNEDKKQQVNKDFGEF